MKFNRLITTAAILLAGAFCTAQAAPTMAKHMQKGVTCEQCHNSSAPVAAAKSKACMKCHNYQDLAAASAAKKVALNPMILMPDSFAAHFAIKNTNKAFSTAVSATRTQKTNALIWLYLNHS